MKDFKSSLFLLVSMLLLIAIGLLATAFYHFYYKPTVYKSVVEITSKDRIVITSGTRDSLQQVYTAAIANLDNRLDSLWNNTDSLNSSLDNKLTEFYRLRSEISYLLKDETPNANLALARRKVRELTEKITALRFINSDVAKENERLTEIIGRLENKKVTQNKPMPGVEKKPVKMRHASPVMFKVADLRLVALREANDKEKETFMAGETKKLVGSMSVSCKNGNLTCAELIVVILQPDGKVLQGAAIEAQRFQTPQGKKILSSKIKFDCEKGEQKKLQFTVAADNYQQGNYTLQVYQNGEVVANMIKTLL